MADDRPIDGPPEEIGRLTRELDELRAMVNTRFARRPTGDIEPTIRATAKANTLLLQGQTVSRTTYAALWAWVQENALVRPGLFTAGDGSTTFGVPNFSGRVPIGVGTLGTDTYALGALVGEARVTLTSAQMPSHTHGGSTGSESHSHSGSSNSAGSHAGHNAGSVTAASALPGSQDFFFSVANTTQNSNGTHSHSMSINSDTHSHTIGPDGSGQAHENRPPSIAIGWLIWT